MKYGISNMIVSLFLLAIAGSISGCGYKAPPFYPQEKAK